MNHISYMYIHMSYNPVLNWRKKKRKRQNHVDYKSLSYTILQNIYDIYHCMYLSCITWHMFLIKYISNILFFSMIFCIYICMYHLSYHLSHIFTKCYIIFLYPENNVSCIIHLSFSQYYIVNLSNIVIIAYIYCVSYSSYLYYAIYIMPYILT